MFRLEAEKRPLLWVETAALLARQVPDMHFVIFGQGSMREEVLRAAERQGIAARLTLAGVTSDVLSAMSIMDVFLLASFGEGLPNVLLEAQWVGTPVVVTDVGGAKEAVEPGVTGWPIATIVGMRNSQQRSSGFTTTRPSSKPPGVEVRNGSGSNSAWSVW